MLFANKSLRQEQSSGMGHWPDMHKANFESHYNKIIVIITKNKYIKSVPWQEMNLDIRKKQAAISKVGLLGLHLSTSHNGKVMVETQMWFLILAQ